jgi:hypothetical protein
MNFLTSKRPYTVCRWASLPVLLVGLLGVAHAQIGTPVDLGSNQADVANSASLSVTTTQAVPAGASIIVIAEAHSLTASFTGASCSDSAGDSYSVDVSTTTTLDFAIICSTHKLAAPLPANATITVTWSGGGSPFFLRIHAFSVTGLAAAPLDKTASATGATASPSSGATATTAQANELLFGAIVNVTGPSPNTGFSPGTNGTSNNCAATGTPTYTSLGAVGGGSLFGMSCVVSTSGAYAASGTFALSQLWLALLATYKAAPFTTTALAVDINPATTGQTVTFKATVTGANAPGPPTGAVTFKDGSTTLGTGTLNGAGVATFSTSSLSLGVHPITATYAGDSIFSGSSSTVLNETINPPAPTSLTIVANPTSLSLASGQSGTVALTITGNGSNPVSVNCVPVTVSCTVSTPVVGSSSTSATLTIGTALTFARNAPPAFPGAFPRGGQMALVLFGTVLPVGMLIIPICRRNRKRGSLNGRRAIQAVLGLLLLIIVFVFVLGMAGCGGGNARIGAPVFPGTYSVTVTASSGSLSGTTNVGVTVH